MSIFTQSNGRPGGEKVCARPLSRRDLLKSALALGPALYIAPHVILRGAFGAPAAGPGKNVILVELFGGNDGFNCIVPFGVNGGTYYNEFRKHVNIPENTLIKINNEVGFNPVLGALVNGLSLQNGLWNHQHLAIVQGVSYPNPNFSHETSAGIWAKGDPSLLQSQGWLSRVLAQIPSGVFPIAADISDRVTPVFLNSTKLVPSIESLEGFAFPADYYYLPDAQNRRNAYQTIVNNLKSGAASKTQTVAQASSAVLDLIDAFATIQPITPAETYPEDSISDALQLAVTLLKSNLGFRFIHLGIGGFDTHSNQNQDNYHNNLIKTVADALAAANTDLIAQGIDQDTIIVVYSEFGRTVYENGSFGCDHGTVNPVFVMGTSVTGGLVGAHPAMDPSNLSSNGELAMTTDFRDVFGTIVSKWLQIDPALVFPGYSVNLLPFLP